MGLLPYSYCSSGVLVSFFMFTMSYRYKFPSAACRINISILNILNRSRSPVSLLYTGSANPVSYTHLDVYKRQTKERQSFS